MHSATHIKSDSTPPSILGLVYEPPVAILSASYFILGNLQSTTQLTFTNMPSIKRKTLDAGLQRRVRARREASEDVDSTETASDKGGDPTSEGEDNSDSGESAEEVCRIHLLSNPL